MDEQGYRSRWVPVDGGADMVPFLGNFYRAPMRRRVRLFREEGAQFGIMCSCFQLATRLGGLVRPPSGGGLVRPPSRG